MPGCFLEVTRPQYASITDASAISGVSIAGTFSFFSAKTPSGICVTRIWESPCATPISFVSFFRWSVSVIRSHPSVCQFLIPVKWSHHRKKQSRGNWLLFSNTERYEWWRGESPRHRDLKYGIHLFLIHPFLDILKYNFCPDLHGFIWCKSNMGRNNCINAV